MRKYPLTKKERNATKNFMSSYYGTPEDVLTKMKSANDIVLEINTEAEKLNSDLRFGWSLERFFAVDCIKGGKDYFSGSIESFKCWASKKLHGEDCFCNECNKYEI